MCILNRSIDQSVRSFGDRIVSCSWTEEENELFLAPLLRPAGIAVRWRRLMMNKSRCLYMCVKFGTDISLID
uniref:Uncharacterized protein n=1 Tax=Triticum urartu TaxID=4572 RepID=A0A8R7TDU4_TRIUA